MDSLFRDLGRPHSVALLFTDAGKVMRKCNLILFRYEYSFHMTDNIDINYTSRFIMLKYLTFPHKV